MKKINEFFENAAIWKVYIASYFITGIFMFILFQLSEMTLMTIEGKKTFTLFVNLKIGALSGIVFGLMMTLMISQMRSSRKFWNYVDVVEELINKAETKEELLAVRQKEFKDLINLASGQIQLSELKRILAILETKHKYIK